MKMKIKTNLNAFTLMELTVTLILMGVLASIAIPRAVIQVKGIRNQEGTRILFALYEQQLDFKRENGGANYGSSIANDLFIDIPTPKNFSAPSIYANKIVNTQRVLAGIKDKGNQYTLYITEGGVLICDPVTAGDNICHKMGY